jgi:hypothetical protein
MAGLGAASCLSAVCQTRVTDLVRLPLGYARDVASFRSLLTHRTRAADHALQPAPAGGWTLRRALAWLLGR